MAIQIYKRETGTGLSPEESALLEEAGKLPQVYDEDCPKLTPAQLAQFRPVNFTTMEARKRAMETRKIAERQKKEQLLDAVSNK